MPWTHGTICQLLTLVLCYRLNLGQFFASQQALSSFSVLRLILNSFSRNNCSKILFELTHILAPHWSSEEPCVICAKLLRLSSEPRNLARRCPTPHDIPVATPNQWHQEFGAMIQSVCHTVEKLRDQFALRVLVQEGAPVTLLLFARPDVQSASPPNPIDII